MAKFAGLVGQAPENIDIVGPRETVNVVSPTGEVGSLSQEEAANALNSGWRLAGKEEVLREKLSQRFAGESGYALAAGLARGLSATASDYVLGGLGGQSMKERLSAYKTLYPGQSAAGELAGEGIGLLASGGTSLAAKGLSAPVRLGLGIAGAAERGVARGLGRGILSTAVGGAAEGGLYGALINTSENYLNDIPVDGERLFSAVASGALYGGAIGLGVGTIGKGLNKFTGSQEKLISDMSVGEASSDLSVGLFGKAKKFADSGLEAQEKHLIRSGVLSEAQAGHMAELAEPGNMTRAATADIQAERFSMRHNPKLTSGLEEVVETTKTLKADVDALRFKHIDNLPEGHFFEKVEPNIETSVSELNLAARELVDSQDSAFLPATRDKLFKDINEQLAKYNKSTFKSDDALTKTLKVSDVQATKNAFKLANALEASVDKLKKTAPDAHARLRGIVDELKTGSRGDVAFGDATRASRKIDDLLAKQADAVEKLSKTGLIKDGKFDKGFRSWIRTPDGAAKMHETQAGKAWGDFLKHTKELEETVAALGDSGPASKYLKKIKQARQRFVDANEGIGEVTESLRLKRNHEAIDKAHMRSVTDESMKAGIFMNAGLIAGGAAGGGPIGAGAAFAAGQAYRVASNPRMGIRAAAKINSFLADKAATTARAVDGLDSLAVKSANPKVKAPSKLAPGISLLTITASGGSPEDRYNAIYDKLQQSIGREDDMRAELIKNLQGNSNQMESAIDEAVATAARARNYLLGMALSRAMGHKPSKWEVARFLGAVHGVKYPEKITKRVLSGQATVAELEAYKAVYPRDYEALRKLTAEKINSMNGSGKSLPFAVKVRLSMAFDIDIDEKISLQYMSEMEQSRMGGESGDPQQATRSREGTNQVPELHTLFENRTETLGKDNG